MGGHRLYANADTASDGLRDMFEETLGIDDLPPEVLTSAHYEDPEIGTYYGRFTIEDKEIAFMVAPLEVRD